MQLARKSQKLRNSEKPPDEAGKGVVLQCRLVHSVRVVRKCIVIVTDSSTSLNLLRYDICNSCVFSVFNWKKRLLQHR